MDQLLSPRILPLQSQWQSESRSRRGAGPGIELDVHMMADHVTVITIDFFVETVGIGRGRRMEVCLLDVPPYLWTV